MVDTTAVPPTHEKSAVLYRMVMEKHVCPWGLKAKDLLERQGFKVEDHWLRTRQETDAFMAAHHFKTTPQAFIDGKRVGGYDDLRRYFGKPVRDPKATSYRPIIALFSMTALMALAVSIAAFGTVRPIASIQWFTSLSMCVLALLKLQDIGSFSTMFLNYDLLARRWVRYSYVYPFAEALAGILMTAGLLRIVSIPVALFIGTVGAVSVIYAVYVQKRELKCACVGGSSNVPLGFFIEREPHDGGHGNLDGCKMIRTLLSIGLATGALTVPAFAQSNGGMGNMPMSNQQRNAASSSMPGMDMSNGSISGMGNMKMNGVLGAYPMSRDSSGTSWQPDAAPAMGGMAMWDDWMLMTEARANGIFDSQSGPRGDNMTYASGMGMLMASRTIGDGDTLGLRAMLSIDPFMGRRGYPLLLASGETANGTTPLIDRQHPHDLFMELAGTYSHPISDKDSLFVYFGYPGEPALGPSAYMHRISGIDNPETPISHHWLDSTHITFGVATAGWVHDDWKLEVSQFTGREPDQYRFDFDKATFDSTSVRLSYNPDPNWSFQVSEGFLHSPEQLTPTIDETRYTVSATYFTSLGEGSSLAATAAVGNKHLSDGTDETGALLEAEYKPADPWTIFSRAEFIQSDELLGGNILRNAGKLSLGLIHDWKLAGDWKFGVGGSYDFDFTPAGGTPSYGDDPHGAMAFIRVIAD